MEVDYGMLKKKRAEVRQRYPEVKFPDPVLDTLWVGKRNFTRVPDTKALVDQSTGNVMSIVSDRYKIVRYEDTISMVEDVTKEIDGYGAITLCPSVYAKGGKFKLTMKFPESQHIITSGDGIVPKIDVFNSYDLGYKLMGRFGAFRLRCTNGMGVWEQFKRFARRHLLNLFLEDLKLTILEGMSVFGMQVESWKKWADIEMTQPVYDAAWQMLPFTEPEKEKIEAVREIGNALTLPDALKQKALTLWDMNNVLTQYTTHQVKSPIRRVNLEPAIAKSMESLYLQLA
jgi:hypothetical protein